MEDTSTFVKIDMPVLLPVKTLAEDMGEADTVVVGMVAVDMAVADLEVVTEEVGMEEADLRVVMEEVDMVVEVMVEADMVEAEDMVVEDIATVDIVVGEGHNIIIPQLLRVSLLIPLPPAVNLLLLFLSRMYGAPLNLYNCD
jgi:hypothetical protein